MGWYVGVYHIVEKINTESEAKSIIHEIFEHEGQYAHANNGYFCYFRRESNGKYSAYYYYEVRKYFDANFILILSNKYLNTHFTLITCPELWMFDAAQIIRIYEGKCYDNYGLYPTYVTNLVRYNILSEPYRYKSLIQTWYKQNGKEAKLRSTHPFFSFPSPEDRFDGNQVLDIRDTEFLIANSLLHKSLLLEKLGWTAYYDLRFVPTHEEYEERYGALPSDCIFVDQKSVIAAVHYNPLISEWENELAKHFEWKLQDLFKPFNMYAIKLLRCNQILTIKDLEEAVEEIVDSIFDHYESRVAKIRLGKRGRGFIVDRLFKKFLMKGGRLIER